MKLTRVQLRRLILKEIKSLNESSAMPSETDYSNYKNVINALKSNADETGYGEIDYVVLSRFLQSLPALSASPATTGGVNIKGDGSLELGTVMQTAARMGAGSPFDRFSHDGFNVVWDGTLEELMQWAQRNSVKIFAKRTGIRY